MGYLATALFSPSTFTATSIEALRLRLPVSVDDCVLSTVMTDEFLAVAERQNGPQGILREFASIERL
jgi:hypothetical protein